MSDLKATNTFAKGILTDVNELVAPPDSYRSAINMLPSINDGKDGFLEYAGARNTFTTFFKREDGSTWTVGAGSDQFAAPALTDIVFKLKDEVTEDFYLLYKQPSFDFLIFIRVRNNEVKRLFKISTTGVVLDFEMLTSNAKLINREHIVFLLNNVAYHIPLSLIPSNSEFGFITTHIYPPKVEQLNGTSITQPFKFVSKRGVETDEYDIVSVTDEINTILTDTEAALNAAITDTGFSGFSVKRKGDKYIELVSPYYIKVGPNLSSFHVNTILADSYDITNLTLSKLTLAKRAPFASPFAERKTIVGQPKNVSITNIAPQFAYRYRYLDGSQSTWSELSKCVEPTLANDSGLIYDLHTIFTLGQNSRDLNLSYEIGGIHPFGAFLIEFAVKFTRSGLYLSLGEVELSTLGGAGHEDEFALLNMPLFIFNGNSSAITAAETQVIVPNGGQVILPHSFIPIESNAIGSYTTKDGSSMIVLGGNQEEYDNFGVGLFNISTSGVALYTGTPQVYTGPTGGSTFHYAGVFNFAIQYQDDFDRRKAFYIGTARFDPNTVGPTSNQVDLSTTQRPPSWAKKWKILRTENLKHTRFNVLAADWLITGVGNADIASKVNVGAVTPVHLGPATIGDLDTLYLPISKDLISKDFRDDSPTLEDSNFDSLIQSLSNSAEEGIINGDEIYVNIHLLKRIDNQTIERCDIVHELKVVGYSALDLRTSFNINTNVKRSMYLVCKGMSADLYAYLKAGVAENHNTNIVYEIFTSKGANPNAYYEMDSGGHVGSEVVDGITYYSHLGTNREDQAFGAAPSLWEQRITRGDVFLINPSRRLDSDGAVPNDTNSIIYSPSPLGTIVTQHSDLGRLNTPNDNVVQKNNNNGIRFSGVLGSQTNRHNLCLFAPTDAIYINDDFGDIVSLPSVRNNLLAVCTNAVQPIYVNISELTDLKGSTTLFRSDRVLSIANEVLKQYGALNGSLVTQHEGMVYGYDSVKRIPWRFGQDGLVPWGEMGNRTYFKRGVHALDIKCLLTSDNRDSVFYCASNLNAFVFENKTNTFRGLVTNAPLLNYELADKSLFLGSDHIFNVLQKSGTLESWQMSFVVNTEAVNVKEIENILITGRAKPFTRVKVTPSLENLLGYHTYMESDRYTVYQGYTAVKVLRDINDPNPELLIGIPGGDIGAVVTARRFNGRPVVSRAFLVSFTVIPENLTNFVSETVVYADEIQLIETKLKRIV